MRAAITALILACTAAALPPVWAADDAAAKDKEKPAADGKEKSGDSEKPKDKEKEKEKEKEKQEDDSGRDRPMEELEARLQEQRATAVRFRLALYLDELEKLQTRYNTDDDAAGRAAVTAEIGVVKADMKMLDNIIRRQSEPPAEGEVKKDEVVPPAVLAARRINRIVARFNDAKALARTAGNGAAPPAAVPRSLILKYEKATRNKDRSESGPRSYWGYDNAYALWSIPSLPPGEYEVLFRYTADEKTGGTAIIKMAGTRLEKAIPAGSKGSKEQISAGTVLVKDQGADVRVENGGLAGGANSLWTLDAVLIQPAKRP